jgi:hypothetical protein
MALHTSDPTWQAGHPDLTDAALGELFALAEAYEARAASGEAETLTQLRALRPDAELVSFLLASADHLRAVLAELPVAAAAGIPN